MIFSSAITILQEKIQARLLENVKDPKFIRQTEPDIFTISQIIRQRTLKSTSTQETGQPTLLLSIGRIFIKIFLQVSCQNQRNTTNRP
jgi:hypothetical protein